jgi:hypothetical protein
MDYATLTVHQVCDEAEHIAEDARTAFGQLAAHQINWKPAPGAWSVGQCFDHLIAANLAFDPVFDRILKGEHRPSLIHRVPLVPGIIGRLMIKSLSPESRPKLQAPRLLQPAMSAIEPDIVNRFVMHQRETLVKMRSLADRDPAAVIIRSPLAPVVYSLLDAFRIVVAHERRHMAQAGRVVASEGFPSEMARRP